jgi:hypothetical protein
MEIRSPRIQNAKPSKHYKLQELIFPKDAELLPSLRLDPLPCGPDAISFKHLRSFTACINMPNDQEWRRKDWSSAVLPILSQATSHLVELHVHVQVAFSREGFEITIDPLLALRFSQLKSLQLIGLSASGPPLARFLRDHSSLESFTIDEMGMFAHHWVPVFDAIRNYVRHSNYMVLGHNESGEKSFVLWPKWREEQKKLESDADVRAYLDGSKAWQADWTERWGAEPNKDWEDADKDVSEVEPSDIESNDDSDEDESEDDGW